MGRLKRLAVIVFVIALVKWLDTELVQPITGNGGKDESA